MATRIAVAGVGRMGLPIVRALLEAGHEVVALDPDPARRAAAAEVGATVTSDLGDAAASTSTLLTVLPGAAELAAFGPVPAGPLWIDVTSADPARILPRVDVGAPMAGGIAAARAGTLRFLVGGPAPAIEQARPLLELLGKLEVVGDAVTDGYVAKLLVNQLWFGQVVAVTEALLAGAANGVPAATLLRVLRGSATGSRLLDDFGDRLLAGDDVAEFGLDRIVEELDAAARLAAGVPTPVADAVAAVHRDALARYGAIDGELLAARLLREHSASSSDRG